MLSRSKLLSVLLIGLAVCLSMAVGVALAYGTFTDDDGNVHEGNIELIAAEGITKGCNPPTNNLYCPSSSVTRGQMAAFVRRAFNLPSSSIDFFVDDDKSVFEGDINAVAMAGITKGCNPPVNDRFCPDGNVTREQMAAFLRRAFGYPTASTDYFVDDDSSIFEGDINAIAKAGVTKGCNPPANDRYCPTALVKRDQMASFFARALGLPLTLPPPTLPLPTLPLPTLPPPTLPPPTLPPPTLPPPPAPPGATFRDGVWIVGTDIQPGTYRTDPSSGMCYGARLSGFSGDLADIIANDISFDSMIVTIEPSDAGFHSERCNLWSGDLAPRTGEPTSEFSGGYWLVGTEIAPGLWRNSDSSDDCYWLRLSGFSWEVEHTIASNYSDLIQTVRIYSGDQGFRSERCGSWTYQGP